MDQKARVKNITSIDNQISFLNQKILASESAIEDLNKLKEAECMGCEHTLPDGKTALTGGFFLTDCTICGWDDLFSE